jgi:predicted permease
MQLAADLQQRVSPPRMAEWFRGSLERVASVPGVVAAGATSALPLDGHESMSTIRVDGYPNRPNQTAHGQRVAGDYFRAIQTPLIAGRYLTSADLPAGPGPRVVVVSESFARQYFHGRSAIGGRMAAGQSGTAWSTIVGVVADVRHSSLETPPGPTFYEPSWFVDSLAIRTALPPETVIASVRRALRDAGAPFVLADIQTMQQRTDRAAAPRQFQTVLLAAFAVIAVVLALVGLYGLLSYTLRQRTAEIGVRMALGAGRAQVIAMVLRHGLGLAGIGLLIGLAAAALAARWAASLLYGIHAFDPVTFLMVPLLIMTASAVACFLPAWKASRVDPASSLRHQ